MINFFLSVLTILALILIIIAGVYHYKNRDPIRYSYLLTIMGTISIIWIVCIPYLLNALNFAPGLTVELLSALTFYLLLITTSILSIITFGVIFIIIGIKNSRSFGTYIKNSGDLWFISGLLSLFVVIGLQSYIFFEDIPQPDENITIFLRIIDYIAIVIGIIARVFLLIYAMKLINLLLGVTALLLIIGTLIALIFEIYLNGII